MDQQSLIYKINTLYLETLLSSLMLTLIQDSSLWLTLKSLSCNTGYVIVWIWMQNLWQTITKWTTYLFVIFKPWVHSQRFRSDSEV